MADEHQNSTSEEPSPPSSPGFTQVDEIEYVGAPAHLSDQDEMPGCVANAVLYVFGLPMALYQASLSIFTWFYAFMGVYTVAIFLLLCLLMACLLIFAR